jgi:hypothetical protein
MPGVIVRAGLIGPAHPVTVQRAAKALWPAPSGEIVLQRPDLEIAALIGLDALRGRHRSC